MITLVLLLLFLFNFLTQDARKINSINIIIIILLFYFLITAYHLSCYDKLINNLTHFNFSYQLLIYLVFFSSYIYSKKIVLLLSDEIQIKDISYIVYLKIL